MTPADLSAGKDYLEARWGELPKWEKWELFYSDYSDFTRQELFGVLGDWFLAGHERAPTPSQVLVRLRENRRSVHAYTPEVVEHCEHPQPWFFTINDDGSRTAVCRFCHHEWDAPGVRTPLEIEAGDKWR